MADASPNVDPDFSAQMQALVIEAEQALGDKGGKNGERRTSADAQQAAPPIGFAQMLRPILVGMESLMRSQSVQNMALDRIEKVLEGHAAVPEVIDEARQSLEQRNIVNRAMFDALHTELKGYKDGFLLESVIRPVIRDLISLHDDARELHRQVSRGREEYEASEAGPGILGVLKNLENNLEHHIHYLLEVLERMEVRIVAPVPGKVDKRHHRVLSREPATREEDDLVVLRSVRSAFTWRDRLFRPEEVVVLKWGLTPEASPESEAADSASADSTSA